jgi:hypothetical protein
MDIFFQDPSEVPLPPDEVRIRELRAEPWPDGRRIHVYFEVDPFQRKPSADILIQDEQDEERASVSIIETVTRKMEFNMHIRGEQPQGEMTISAVLFYADQPSTPESEKPPERQIRVVDRVEKKFSLVV